MLSFFSAFPKTPHSADEMDLTPANDKLTINILRSRNAIKRTSNKHIVTWGRFFINDYTFNIYFKEFNISTILSFKLNEKCDGYSSIAFLKNSLSKNVTR